MESWRCSIGNEGKGIVYSDEIDSFGNRGRKSLTGGWDMEFIDLGFSDIHKKQFYTNSDSNSGFGVSIGNNSEIGFHSSDMNNGSKVGLAASPPTVMIGSNSSLESGSNQSNSVMECNSQDSSSLIDLKLGRFDGDGKNEGIALVVEKNKNSKCFKETPGLLSVVQTSRVKKARTSGSRTQTAFCLVYGCNKDLSGLKDYHKRHKVCEIHSKTPKVIVNGVEQRFCQQCSRFHLLVEFDDGKRSCRKRLAGHNERRRKPQFGNHSGRPHKILQSYQGTKFFETSLAKRASFLFPDMLPGNVIYPETFEQTSGRRSVKLEEKSIYSMNDQLPSKSFFHLHGNGIQNTSGISPPATEDFTFFNTASTIHELAGASHSSCALSLLSAESQDLSHSAGIIVARPLINQAGRSHPIGSASDKSFLGSSEKYAADVFHSSGMNSLKPNHMGSSMVSRSGHISDFQIESDELLQDQLFNDKYCVSSENGSTVDLLQLSSHLQRIEQQRNSIQVKHEMEDCSSFLTTYGA